jgi:hypothetical protein
MFFEVLTSVCPKLTPVSFPGSWNLLSLPQTIPQVIWLYSRIDGQNEFHLFLTPNEIMRIFTIVVNCLVYVSAAECFSSYCWVRHFSESSSSSTVWLHFRKVILIVRLHSQSVRFVAPSTASIDSIRHSPTVATSTRRVSHPAVFKIIPSQLNYNWYICQSSYCLYNHLFNAVFLPLLLHKSHLTFATALASTNTAKRVQLPVHSDVSERLIVSRYSILLSNAGLHSIELLAQWKTSAPFTITISHSTSFVTNAWARPAGFLKIPTHGHRWRSKCKESSKWSRTCH